MNKSFRSTLLLVAVFALLLGWYLVYEKRIKVDQAEKEEQSKVLVTLDREAIQEITLEQRQGTGEKAPYLKIRFKKTGAEWNIVEPVEDRAEGPALSGMLSALTSTKFERIVEEKPQDLVRFGLEAPRLKISARKDSTSPAQELWIGDDTPIDSGLYVKIAGQDTVYRTPQILRTSFDKAPSEYRNKKVLTLSRADILAADIRVPSGGFLLQRQGTSENWLLAREGLPASESQVNKLLNTLVSLRAENFASEQATPAELARYGLKAAPLTFYFETEQGKSNLAIGKVKDKVYAKSSDRNVILEIPADTYDKAAVPAKTYEDRNLARFNRFDVKKIRIQHGPESFELVKDSGGWKFPEKDGPRADTEQVEDFLTRLQDVKVQSFIKQPKLQTPDLVIRLFATEAGAESEKEKVTLRVQKPKGKVAYGDRAGLDRVFTLALSDFNKINAFKQEFLASDKKAENKTGK